MAWSFWFKGKPKKKDSIKTLQNEPLRERIPQGSNVFSEKNKD
jgi:hypothetical protein